VRKQKRKLDLNITCHSRTVGNTFKIKSNFSKRVTKENSSCHFFAVESNQNSSKTIWTKVIVYLASLGIDSKKTGKEQAKFLEKPFSRARQPQTCFPTGVAKLRDVELKGGQPSKR